LDIKELLCVRRLSAEAQFGMLRSLAGAIAAQYWLGAGRDDLETSIVFNLEDDVTVSIAGSSVRITVFKQFCPAADYVTENN